MSAISSFRNIENRHDVYIGKGSMFCEYLREHVMKIIFLKNEIINKRRAEII